MNIKLIKKIDAEIEDLIQREEKRQSNTLNLIPSENYCSPAIREALATVFSAKYAEGRPFQRYYAGMENIDLLETIVEERARKLFGLNEHWAINTQPLSGGPANYAILRGLLKPGEKLMALALDQGGHLSHGHAVNFSGLDFKVINYYLDKKTHLLNYEVIEKIAKKEKPKVIIAGFTAYPRKIDFRRFSQIAKKVGAYLLADISHLTGLIVAGVHPSPFPWAEVVMTTTHKTLRGPRGAMIICRQELEKKIFSCVFPGLQGGPHLHTICAIGVALKEAMTEEFKKYGQQIVKNAKALAQELKKNGFQLITRGTDNHLLLIDLTNKNITGAEAQLILEKAGIITNKNTIPYDFRSPVNPSGLRIGTPALTTRGMKEKEMKQIANWIKEVIADPTTSKRIKREVEVMCHRFPLP